MEEIIKEGKERMANLQATTLSGSLIHKEGTATLSGTSITIDLATGRSFEVDLQGASGNIATFNITGAFVAGTRCGDFLLNVTQGSTARNILWGSLTGVNPRWPGDGGSAGSGPTITTTNDKKDIFYFSTWNAGTTWYARIIGQNF